MKIGDKVKHKLDGYTGTIKSIDNIFIHLEDGRHILKCYAQLVKRKEEDYDKD